MLAEVMNDVFVQVCVVSCVCVAADQQKHPGSRDIPCCAPGHTSFVFVRVFCFCFLFLFVGFSFPCVFLFFVFLVVFRSAMQQIIITSSHLIC